MMNKAGREGFDPIKGLVYGAIVLLSVILIGSGVFWLIGNWVYADRIEASGARPWTFLTCLYFTVITVTTIGYGDPLDTSAYPLATAFTFIMAFIGMGVPIFLITMINTLIIEGFFSDMGRKRKMKKRIDNLTDHYIVCGAGETGRHAINELYQTQRPFVVIDVDVDLIHKRVSVPPDDLLVVVGDATDDKSLMEAGIMRARGLIAALPNDKDNLFLSMAARQFNPALRIVTRAVDVQIIPRMIKAGADVAVSPNNIGGMRMVSELVRPGVTSFLDTMLKHSGKFRFEEITVTPGCKLENKTIADARLKDYANALIVAVRHPGETLFQYNPGADTELKPGTLIVILATATDLNILRKNLCTPA